MGRRRRDGETEEAGSTAREPAETDPLGGGEPAWADRRVAVVDEIIGRLEQQLTDTELKGSIGDYIRLIQVRKDLGDDFEGEVRASWVGS